MSAIVILRNVVFCALMIWGGWAARRRVHPGTNCFLAGCGLLALEPSYHLLNWLAWALGMTSTLGYVAGINLWLDLKSMMSLLEVIGFGLLILGIFRSFRWAS